MYYVILYAVSRVDGTYSWVSYSIRITTLVGEELPSLDLNSNLGYMKKEQGTLVYYQCLHPSFSLPLVSVISGPWFPFLTV